MSAERVARAHYRARRRLIRAVADLARGLWRQVDVASLDASWPSLGARLAVALAGAQLAAAQPADDYLTAVLDAQGVDPADQGRLRASALSGTAADGRMLDSLLRHPVIVTKTAIGAGQTTSRALAAGYANLDMIVRTEVADAGRVADQVALTARRSATGYVRMVVGKTCSRCLILAGRRYGWNQGFRRHPRCDCIHIPAAEDTVGDLTTNPRAAFEAMSREEQDRVFTEAGAEAIRDGADMARVVNARRGMDTAGESRTRINQQGLVVNERRRTQVTRRVAGRDVFVTTEAAGRRPRLMPEQIFREADGNRDEALRLLRLHGYLI